MSTIQFKLNQCPCVCFIKDKVPQIWKQNRGGRCIFINNCRVNTSGLEDLPGTLWMWRSKGHVASKVLSVGKVNSNQRRGGVITRA